MNAKSIGLEVKRIKEATAKACSVTAADIDGESREADIVKARHLSMLFCRRLLGLSYPAIAEAFHKPTHVTALLACRAMESKIAKDKAVAVLAKRLENEIGEKFSKPNAVSAKDSR
jgi:chromosomal replication initiator protein